MNPSYILHLKFALKFLISCTVIEKLNSEITPNKVKYSLSESPFLTYHPVGK